MLCSHVLEHISQAVADDIVAQYLPYVRHGGQVVFITAQEVGFRSDETHIRWVDREVTEAHATRHGLTVSPLRTRSRCPPPAGEVFKCGHEFVTSRP